RKLGKSTQHLFFNSILSFIVFIADVLPSFTTNHHILRTIIKPNDYLMFIQQQFFHHTYFTVKVLPIFSGIVLDKHNLRPDLQSEQLFCRISSLTKLILYNSTHLIHFTRQLRQLLLIDLVGQFIVRGQSNILLPFLWRKLGIIMLM